MAADRPAPTAPQRDPWVLCLLLTLGFLGLCLWNLGIPSKLVFDEIHYVSAARHLIALDHPFNREHPMLGKEIIAASMMLLGDHPFAWRLPSALAGALTLHAAMRAVWCCTLSRCCCLLTGILIATGFMLFVQSRTAMLDIYMLCFAMTALWALAYALRNPGRARLALVLAGLSLGLSLSAKWNVVAVAMLPGITFLILAIRHRRRDWLLGRKGLPINGISLAEAGVWLGLVPLLVYFGTFIPTMFLAHNPTSPWGLLQYQADMLRLQDSVTKPHAYMSRWWQWVLNIRVTWYFYEVWDGAQRGIVMLGNPLTMLLGLPAVGICAWRGIRNQDKAMLAAAVLYGVAIGMWIVAPKPIQFFYHYLLPSLFLMIALALVLGCWWDGGRRWPAWAVGGLSVAFFVYFFPVLAGTPLAHEKSFRDYAWIKGWR